MASAEKPAVALMDNRSTASAVDADLLGRSSAAALEDRFAKLATAWAEQSTYLSSMEQQCALAPYQEIVAMGWPVVPLILKRLERDPDWWFWALQSITGENPVSESAQGDLIKMTDAWLQRGRRKNLI